MYESIEELVEEYCKFDNCLSRDSLPVSEWSSVTKTHNKIPNSLWNLLMDLKSHHDHTWQRLQQKEMDVRILNTAYQKLQHESQ
jgi:hypothetical protein